MTEQRTNDQNSNQEAITNLKRLREIAADQQKDSFVQAIDAALKALGDDDQGENKDDGLRLSGSASNQLIQLAQQVRDTTLTPTQRTAAASRLVRMGGGR